MKQENSNCLNVAIVGAGAAGYFGAIRCAELSENVSVSLFEATTRPLTKVKISGGGRCNVTHSCFDPKKLVSNYPRGERELLSPFNRFQPKDTVSWFEARGVKLKAEDDGRMFPSTNSSETIIQCLQKAALDAGVVLRIQTPIESIVKHEKRFSLSFRNGTTQDFDRVLLSTGSSPAGHALAEALGHKIVKPCPSLFTFKIDDPLLKDLAGLSFDFVKLRLQFADHPELKQEGPLLITHWGLSGPAVLKLSAWGARPLYECDYHATLLANFTPSLNQENALQILMACKNSHNKKHVVNHKPFDIPTRFWERLVNLNISRKDMLWADVAKKELTKIAENLVASRFSVIGKGVFKEEFVTCGGVSLKEVDFRTMESRVCSGLYFAGEILDIDGITGGFNFQNAWTGGWLAGEALAAG